ncbi:LamB/YcsF family protein, partial [Endozoicomonas sp.]|uniref:LamB/YcsF family protein n=1 Tax=Endozoicomonas sp. TaxID=1892382 RepID=UPI00383AC8E4
AVYQDSALIRQQVMGLVSGEIKTIKGAKLKLKADTVCVHGDNPESIALIKELHQLLNP